MTLATAFCDAAGVVEIREGTIVPDGMLPVFRTRSLRRTREVAEIVCRHAYDGKTLLVPGLPEAKDQAAGLDALLAFRARLRRDARKGVYL